MATSSPEVQGKHDAHAFKKGGDNSQALQHVADQAHSMSSKDLKSEQAYWNSLGKASHDHLPGLNIHRNNDGNVDSVKNDKGESMYDRSAKVQEASEKATGKLKSGQGPFQAFKEAGMSDREASEHAKAVTEGMGRHSFKAGEKLAVHSDGSVSTSTEKNGVTTQEKFNQGKPTEKTTTQANGDSVKTILDDKGNPSKTIEHKVGENGKSTDTTYDGDGSSRKLQERTVNDGDSKTTTKYKDDGKTPTEMTKVTPDKTVDTKFADDGVKRKETVETDKQGLKTTTEFGQGDKNLPTSQHKELPNDSYVDTKYKADGTVDSTLQHNTKPDRKGFTETETKDGKVSSTYDRTNLPNGAYTEKTHREPSLGQNVPSDTLIEHTAKDANGKFQVTRTDNENGMTTIYKTNETGLGQVTKLKDGKPITQGYDAKPHNIKRIDDYHYQKLDT